MIVRGQIEGSGIDASNDHGLWVLESDGTLSPLVRQGVDFPSNPEANLFFETDSSGFGLVHDSGAIWAQDSVLWAHDPEGSVREIAREGGLAPGTGGQRFQRLATGPTGAVGATILTGATDTNPSGNVAFIGILEGPDLSEHGVWWFDSKAESYDILLRSGDEDPSGASDDILTSILGIELDRSGQLAFLARTDRGFGAWIRGSDGTAERRLSEDTPLLGLPDEFGEVSPFFIRITEHGHLVLGGSVDLPPGGDDPSTSITILVPASGPPRVMTLFAGTELELAPGDVRTVSASFDFVLSPDGTRYYSTVQFEDRTSAILSWAVPEPGLLLGLACLWSRRRMQRAQRNTQERPRVLR